MEKLREMLDGLRQSGAALANVCVSAQLLDDMLAAEQASSEEPNAAEPKGD